MQKYKDDYRNNLERHEFHDSDEKYKILKEHSSQKQHG